MKTYIPKGDTIEKNWYVIDATDKILGKVAVEAAKLLRGKHKPTYTPSMDCGDHVIVLNADKALVTGNKAVDKMYYRHSGYPGGLSETNYGSMVEKHPTRAMELAIKGMLPKNSLGRKIMTNVRVYAGAEHPHAAQMPTTIEL